MKILNLRWIACFIFIWMASGIVACSPRVQQMKGAGSTQLSVGPQLTNIEVTDLSDSTQILLEAEEALRYTSFTLSDPPRLIIDLSDISAGEFREPISVNKGAVEAIYPTEADIPVRATRLDIKLVSEPIEYRMYRSDKALVIDISKKMEETRMEQETLTQISPESQIMESKEAEALPIDIDKVEGVIEAKPADKEERVAEERKALNIIRDIEVITYEGKTNIIISADKDINANTFTLGDNRLVIDVKDAKHSIPKEEISLVDNKVISKIRIGRHITPVSKVRIVADLRERVTYEVSKEEKRFIIRIQVKTEKTEKTTPEKMLSKAKISQPKQLAPPGSDKMVPAPSPSSTPPKYLGKKVSLDFQDADIINVLRLLAEVSTLNMVIGDNVKGKVTIKMLDVPWDQALDVILKMKGLGKVYEDNVLIIDTLSNIAQQQEEEARAKEAMIKAEDLVTKILPINYAKASDISESIKKSLSARGEMTLDNRTNTLIIKDIRDNHEEIGKLIKTLDKPTPQVLIEARIVQADSNFARDLGVQWGGNYYSNPGDYNIGIVSGPGGSIGSPATTGTTDSPTRGFAVNLPATGIAGTKGSAGFAIGKTVGDAFNLDLRLSAGEAKGLTKVLSAPKIATLDNREATIQQGESIPYKTLSQEGTKTEFIDATLTLKVTPKVTPDGHISMNIKITKNRQGSIVVEGTPSINKKEATTEVLVKDGETTVIGGIYEISDVDNVNRIPWFHQIPIVGWLFKSTQKSNIKSELLIFITPKIIPTAS